MIWFRLLEVWASSRLLRSPAFHRAVHRAYKGYRRLRHGTPMEEMGGTNIERGPSLLKHFKDELKEQLRGGRRR